MSLGLVDSHLEFSCFCPAQLPIPLCPRVLQLEDAATSFRNAIALCPEYVVAHRNLGDAYERLKRLKPALESYEEAVRIDPEDKTSREKLEYVRRIAQRRGEG